MRYMKSFGLLLLLAGVFTSSVYAQSANCVRRYLSSATNERTTGMAATDAETLVREVSQSIGLSREVRVVPCSTIVKVQAWVGPVNDTLEVAEFIIFDPNWVREVLGRNRVMAIALFGHELGHLLNADFTVRKDIPRRQKELDADRFAGCAVARLAGNFALLEDLFSRLRREHDNDYPDVRSSIETARVGFSECMKPIIHGEIRCASAGEGAGCGTYRQCRSGQCRLFPPSGFFSLPDGSLWFTDGDGKRCPVDNAAHKEAIWRDRVVKNNRGADNFGTVSDEWMVSLPATGRCPP